ncbi:MAG: thioredoxin [Clostridia bacterium]|nr:thioredoxin [Clostridia bacterium]
MEVIKLNNENFKTEVLESNKVVLIDFYADWCGPCKMMSPVIDEIANEVSENVKVCKLNVDEAQDIAIQYNVMSIPTLVIIKDGKVVDTLVGLRAKSEVLESINNAL